MRNETSLVKIPKALANLLLLLLLLLLFVAVSHSIVLILSHEPK